MDDRDHDDELSPEAKTILRYAAVAGLKTNAAELSALYAAMSEADRARLLVLLGLDLDA